MTYISEDGSFGGPVSVALTQSEQLATQGHDVHLYAAWDGKAAPVAEGVTFHLYKARVGALGFSAVFNAKLIWALRSTSKEYDVVHVHFGRDVVSITSAMSALSGAMDGKLFLQTHGMVMPDSRLRARLLDTLLVRRLLTTAQTVFALTDLEREGLRTVSRGGATVRSIQNGIKIQAGITSTRAAPKVVLFLARLHPRKNALVFAQAAKHLIDAGARDVQFTLIGPDEGQLETLNNFIDQHALSPHLRYAGTIGPGDGPATLSNASIYVLPSVGEVFPMTVLEAMAVATPVVLSKDCGLSESLAQANAAKVCAPIATELAQAIRELLDDEDERIALANRGHHFALTHFSSAAVGATLEQIYGTDRV